MNRTETSKNDLLVIGYGNTLRGDDGVGVLVARALDDLKLPGLRCIACHQLAPELAQSISECGEVIFVDAAAEPISEIELRKLEPAPTGQIMAHAADPRTLLSLARDVFGHCPPASCMMIPARNMELGEVLSPETEAARNKAVLQIAENAMSRIRTLLSRN